MRAMLLGLPIMAVTASIAAAVMTPLKIGPEEVFGPSPELDEPTQSWLPTVKIPKPVGWKNGEAPAAAPGLSVVEFAADLYHPRWLYVLPNGGVLVAETNRPPNEAGGGIKAWAMSFFMGKAGAVIFSSPSL